MKAILRRIISYGFHFFFLSTVTLQAVDFIEAKDKVAYQQYHNVFSKVAKGAIGFVRLEDGFTVMPDAKIYMACIVPVAGAIDLRDSGSVTLMDDLVFDSNVTFSSGGSFSSSGKSLRLSGDLTIPTGAIIHCAGEMIIDGNGHEIYLEPHAQILVDANGTVTLRNVIISSERMGENTPALKSHDTGKLCLDNVLLNLNNDLHINQGRIFIHHDVVVSGTSVLLYQSPEAFNIAENSMLYMDHRSTFSFAPKSDQLERLHMHDLSSKMMLSTAKFISTGDDLNLPRGTIIFDGVSHFEHYGAQAINTDFHDLKTPPQEFTSSLLRKAAWSPDGKYLVMANGPSDYTEANSVTLYSFDGNTLTQCGESIAYGFNNDDYNNWVNAISWFPGSDYVAVGTGKETNKPYTQTDGYVNIYQATAIGFQANSNIGPLPTNEYVSRIAASPDNKLIAIGAHTYSSGTRQNENFYIYDKTATDLPQITLAVPSFAVDSLDWDSSGDYLVSAGDDYNTKNGYVKIYDKNLSIKSSKELSKEAFRACSWSPHDNYVVALGSNSSYKMYVFPCDANKNLSDSINTSLGEYSRSAAWFPISEQKILVSKTSEGITMYEFDGTSLKASDFSYTSDKVSQGNLAWVPEDGSYLLEYDNDDLNIYQTVFDKEFVPAAGKKVHLGPKSDLNVTMMPGTRVNLHGDVTKH